MDRIILELLASSEHQAEGPLVPLALPHQPPPRTSGSGGASGIGPEGGWLAHVPACVWGLVPALSHLSSCVLERRMCTMPRTNTHTGLLGGKTAQGKEGGASTPSRPGILAALWALCMCVCVCPQSYSEFSTREFSNQREHGEKVTEPWLTSWAPSEESS